MKNSNKVIKGSLYDLFFVSVSKNPQHTKYAKALRYMTARNLSETEIVIFND
jgi:hypothetical protein